MGSIPISMQGSIPISMQGSMQEELQENMAELREHEVDPQIVHQEVAQMRQVDELNAEQSVSDQPRHEPGERDFISHGSRGEVDAAQPIHPQTIVEQGMSQSSDQQIAGGAKISNDISSKIDSVKLFSPGSLSQQSSSGCQEQKGLQEHQGALQQASHNPAEVQDQ